MKTILVFVGGGDRDQVVLQTALAAARPLCAHLDCLHVHVRPGQAARYSHVEFVTGPALRHALEDLDKRARSFPELAAGHVRDFCAREMIEMRDPPAAARHVTASFREESDNALERLAFHARRADLVVMGRARQKQGLAPDTLERLVLSCGRPMLIAASAPPAQFTGTILVCWKESGNAARAVAAATPILAKAKRVVFASVKERDDGGSDAVHDLARRFAGNGVSPEVQIIPANGRGIAGALAAAAEDCGADLLVMGAYGRSRARQLLFGSCTETFFRHADKPILLMH